MFPKIGRFSGRTHLVAFAFVNALGAIGCTPSGTECTLTANPIRTEAPPTPTSADGQHEGPIGSSAPTGSAVTKAIPPTQPPLLTDDEVRPLRLSPTGETALRELAGEKTFGGWAVGAAGSPTPGVRALRDLSKEKNAAVAFELLLDRATMAGQLMALAGLFDADPAAFAAALPRYRGARGEVDLMESGCGGPIPTEVATIVESPKAMRLQGPDDNLQKWSQRNPKTPIEFDIAGGGYTAVMRPR
jgi:hypothetical protein